MFSSRRGRASTSSDRTSAVTDARSAPSTATLRYVRVKLDGTKVLRTLIEGASGLAVDCSGCQNTGAPPARIGFAATASAREQMLWVANGTTAGQAIWRFNTATRTWSAMTSPPVTFGVVQAIAYEPSQRLVLVLDTVQVGQQSKLRLIRMPPHGGGADVWAEWTRASATTDFGLAPDGLGNVFITASTTTNHCAILFELPNFRTGGRVRPVGSRQGTGRIQTETLTADRRGLSAVTLASGAMSMTGYRPADLVPFDLDAYQQCF